MPEISSNAALARARFIAGKGVEFFYGDNHLILIPSPLYSDTGKIGLAIILEGKGCHIWDGKEPCDVFDLTGAGFPLMLAESTAFLVWEIFPFLDRWMNRTQVVPKLVQSTSTKPAKSHNKES